MDVDVEVDQFVVTTPETLEEEIAKLAFESVLYGHGGEDLGPVKF